MAPTITMGKSRSPVDRANRYSQLLGKPASCLEARERGWELQAFCPAQGEEGQGLDKMSSPVGLGLWGSLADFVVRHEF